MSEIPETYASPSGDASAQAIGASLPGGRVDLRRISAEDGCRFTELTAASTELHRRWIDSLPITPDTFDRYLAKFDQDTAVGFVVCLRTNPTELVGFVNIDRIEYGPFRKGVLGYGAFAPHNGRGYMTEAVALAVRYGFELGLHRLEADIERKNEASRKLAKKVGLHLEGFSSRFIKRSDGVWHDFERWAIINGSMN